MIEGKSVLAVILARGGSKRVPRKNLREYRGTPLIQLAYDVALQSQYIDFVVLSSDDEEILAYADSLSLPRIKRPAELATDTATSEDALRHAIHTFNDFPHWIVLLQPTSPNRTVEDIDGCIETSKMGDGCISTLHGEPNGAVYVAKSEWLIDHNFSDPGLFKYAMEASHSLDIDHEEDFSK